MIRIAGFKISDKDSSLMCNLENIRFNLVTDDREVTILLIFEIRDNYSLICVG